MATATSVSIATVSDHSWRRNSIESVLSIQGKETDVVRDTTDTESPSLTDEDLEYEPVTDPEPDDGPVAQDSSGDSDKDIIKTKVIEVRVRDDGDLVFADSEPADSEETDSEMDFADYWKCAQCHAKNNNPLYRYCEKCFKVRKNFFPPRPKRKFNYKPKTKREPEFKYITTVVHLSQTTDSGVDTVSTSQELSQSETTELSSQTSEATCYSGVSEPSCSRHNVILSRSNLKRRAESADRNLKRAKTASDSDSDETDIERDRRFRKSRSLEKDVAPLVKTVSDPSLTVDHHVLVDDKGAEIAGDNMCIVCLNEPKSGVFVHGRIAHICCCYKCAVKVWSKSKRCPVCNCKVSNVLRAVVM